MFAEIQHNSIHPYGAIASRWRPWCLRLIALAMMVLMGGSVAFAYSILTHEEIVDLLWKDEIRPLLLKRFPALTEEQLTEAHSYAYGGAVIQDLGYYPFSSLEFSDLVHYIRSGDFVRELILESQDANEYAFALGSLAHFVSDADGHPAVNQAVALRYPKLRAKFGNSVRYADGKTEHLKTEFGFDTVQVAKNRYSSQQYHDFIGFQVSKPLLERVFPVIYGMKLTDILPREDMAIASYRFSVAHLIPEMTQVALRTHKKELMSETPGFEKQKFLYRLSRSDYEKAWGKDHPKPGIGAETLAVTLKFMPKVGPFKAMAFDNPTPQTEEIYFKSINLTVDHYKLALEQVRTNSLVLANRDLDTGKPTLAGEYSLTDNAYAKLLSQLADHKFDMISAELRADILHFYSDLSLPFETKKDNEQWQAVLKSLDSLKLATPSPTVTETSTRHSQQPRP